MIPATRGFSTFFEQKEVRESAYARLTYVLPPPENETPHLHVGPIPDCR